MDEQRSFDRRFGQAIRTRVGSLPGGLPAGRIAADVLAPAFQGVVAAMLVRPRSRRAGVEALAAGALAATAARLARDCIDRPRPGARGDAGFPSRHAAAAVAIAGAVGRRHPTLRPVLFGAAALGLTGRIVSGQHDPADIAAGTLVGAAAGWITRGVLR